MADVALIACPICGLHAGQLPARGGGPMVLSCYGSHRQYEIDPNNRVIERLNELDRRGREAVFARAARYAIHRGDPRPKIDVTSF